MMSDKFMLKSTIKLHSLILQFLTYIPFEDRLCLLFSLFEPYYSSKELTMPDDGVSNKSMMIRQYLIGEKEIPTFQVPKEPLHKISKVLRTPDAAFANIPDFPFEPHYFESKIHGNLRIHYIDEGRRRENTTNQTQETILLLHGEPTWSFLYRKMIPLFVREGFRVVAPDLVGFGKSDKPALTTDYSYERQVDWMTELLVGIDLDRCTPFLQDWGGLIGLRVVARLPERFHRLVLSNTGLPMGGSGVGSPSHVSKTFRLWASVVSQQIPRWQDIIKSGCNTTLSEAELDAYDAPFPNEDYKAASSKCMHVVKSFLWWLKCKAYAMCFTC
jgi:haloalkane dehalogenase